MLGCQRGYVIGEAFPWKELAALFLPQFASAVAITSLFPYIGYMIVYLKMSRSIETAGYFAGFIASAVMLGRITSSLIWGSIADRYGRKPVILTCCAAISISSFAFGFTTNFWMAVGIRLIFGIMNPIVGIARTVITEVCSKTHESTGMGTVSGAWFLGLTVGPAVGGLLARPCELYPSVFEKVTIFKMFPYLLPNLVCSILGVASFISVLIWFPETLPPEDSKILVDEVCKQESCSIDNENSNLVDDSVHPPQIIADKCTNSASNHTQPTSMVGALMKRGVSGVMISYGLVSAISMTFDEVFPLWAMSSKSVGGLYYDTQLVGTVVSLTGILLMLYNLFVYPRIANLLGPHKSFLAGLIVGGPMILLTSSAGQLSLQKYEAFALVTTLIGLMKMSFGLSFCSISLIINHLVDTRQRASLNGFVSLLDSVAKMIGLAYGPVIYAWSIAEKNTFPLDFHFAFLVLFLMAYLSLFTFSSALMCCSSESAATDSSRDPSALSSLRRPEKTVGIRTLVEPPAGLQYVRVVTSESEETEDL